MYGRPTACGHVIERSTIGFAHPVLPCGAKIYVGHGGKEVLTQVVARGPLSARAQFGLTDALARELGIDSRATIRWRFAQRT
jgi:rare lipoprotein A (peptidoglycan hydrolase)